MGASLVYLDRPNTQKETMTGKGPNYNFAVSSMQGWRINMVIDPNLLIYTLHRKMRISVTLSLTKTRVFSEYSMGMEELKWLYLLQGT